MFYSCFDLYMPTTTNGTATHLDEQAHCDIVFTNNIYLNDFI